MPQDNQYLAKPSSDPEHRRTVSTVYSPSDALDNPDVVAETGNTQARRLDTAANSPEPPETTGLTENSMFKEEDKTTADTQKGGCCINTCTIT
jgi:hypothetical protein